MGLTSEKIRTRVETIGTVTIGKSDACLFGHRLSVRREDGITRLALHEAGPIKATVRLAQCHPTAEELRAMAALLLLAADKMAE